MVGDGGALVQVMFGCCVIVYNLCVQCRAPLAQVAEGQYQHGYKLDKIRRRKCSFHASESCLLYPIRNF